MADLEQLKALRSFLIQQAVPLQGDEGGAMWFGELNLLRRPLTPVEDAPNTVGVAATRRTYSRALPSPR
jgi:hypothetical protein